MNCSAAQVDTDKLVAEAFAAVEEGRPLAADPLSAARREPRAEDVGLWLWLGALALAREQGEEGTLVRLDGEGMGGSP